VPVAVFVAMIGGGASARTLTASAQTTSPPTSSAAQLLTDIQNARSQPVSGTVVERADLGLPAMPSPSGGGANLRSLLSGSHTLRVWYAGPNQSRIALVTTLGETDVIRNGKDLWVWDSQKNTATHTMLPGGAGAGQSACPSLTPSPSPSQSAGAGQTPGPSGGASTSGAANIQTPSPSGSESPSGVANIQTPSPSGSESPSVTPSLSLTPSGTPSASATAMTPQEISNKIIAKLDPYTNISTRSGVRVSGRAANELVLSPRDARSLVDRVTVAVDAQKKVPLRVQIFARRYTNPAFELAFTQVNFAPPNPAQFNFTPPPGATVKEAKPHKPQGMQQQPPMVVGKGWTSVVIKKIPPQATATPQASPSGRPGFSIQNLPAVSGSWGSGHLLSSRLFNVLFTDDGRVLAGAVPPQLLYQAAAQAGTK
jgi:outer membrane lipoprotein-sorting protein